MFLARIEESRIGDDEAHVFWRTDQLPIDADEPKPVKKPVKRTRVKADSFDDAMATMIHDLCGPVARVKAVTELLQSELEAIWPETDTVHHARSWLSIIDRAATAMEEQFQVLAEVARAQSAEPLVPHVERLDLMALVRQIVDEYQASNARRVFQVEGEAEALFGMWDHVLLRRAVDNLLGNAVKYTPHDGRVVVSVQCEGEPEPERCWAVVTVQDSGIGIPATDLPHVFDLFQRGSNLTGGERGAGVGLASVNEIVTQHGGTVSMMSTEGIGTAVTVRLPLTAG
jgi:signal transduction histidine kinase